MGIMPKVLTVALFYILFKVHAQDDDLSPGDDKINIGL